MDTELERDSENYQSQGFCYLLKSNYYTIADEADNTNHNPSVDNFAITCTVFTQKGLP